MSANFPIVDQLHAAKSNRDRAGVLLRISDAVLLPFQSQISLACTLGRFEAGSSFIAWRVAALCATRDAHGLLPDLVATELEQWRVTLSKYAAGGGQDEEEGKT